MAELKSKDKYRAIQRWLKEKGKLPDFNRYPGYGWRGSPYPWKSPTYKHGMAHFLDIHHRNGLSTDLRQLDEKIKDIINKLHSIRDFSLGTLENLVPIQYCYILPRNHAVVVFAAYLDALAKNRNQTQLEVYKNTDGLNEYILGSESSLIRSLKEDREFHEIFEKCLLKKREYDLYYYVSGNISFPSDMPMMNIGLSLFVNVNDYLNCRFYRTPDFFRYNFQKFKHKEYRGLHLEQLLYMSYPPSVLNQSSNIGFAWIKRGKELHSNLKDEKIHFLRISSSGIYKESRNELNADFLLGKTSNPPIFSFQPNAINGLYITYFLEKKSQKALNKENCDKFWEDLERFRIKFKKGKFKTLIPYFENISLKVGNYQFSVPSLASQPLYTAFLEFKKFSNHLLKGHLYLYKLVNPFRKICNLPISKQKEVRYNPIIGCPLSCIPKLREFTTPSSVLEKVARKLRESNFEGALKYVRGLFRASEKISKHPQWADKIANRYLS